LTGIDNTYKQTEGNDLIYRRLSIEMLNVMLCGWSAQAIEQPRRWRPGRTSYGLRAYALCDLDNRGSKDNQHNKER